MVAAAVLYLGGLYGHPAACALPLLLLLLIIIEYPPPGSGVGLPAAPLSHLQPIAGTVPLGVDGALEAGCAYTIIFWRGNKQGYTALPQLALPALYGSSSQHTRRHEFCHRER